MNYAVTVVADDELPQGMNSLIVEMDEGPPLLLINGELARCWRFVRAYEDTREPCTLPTVLLPAPPRPLLHAV